MELYAIKETTTMDLEPFKQYGYPAAVFIGLAAGVGAFFSDHHELSHWIWGVTLILGGIPIIWKTITGMLQGQFAADIVASMAIVTAIIMGEYLAGAVVVLMLTGGEALEEYGLRRAKSSLDLLLARAPQLARRVKGDRIEEINVAAVNVDDILLVRQGDLIPVDGQVVEGIAEVDTAAITGEPLPQPRSAGDSVLAGSAAIQGSFTMKATHVAEQSQYAKIVALMRKAQEERAPIERLADRAAIFFTPLTIVMALIGVLWTGEWVTMLSVFVVATPCPLILAVPIAVMAGVSRAARNGIIVKGGAPMEEVGHAQVIIFDKTGTLTRGEPYVSKVLQVDGVDADQLLQLAASVEQFSNHVVAQAIVREAQQTGKLLELPEEHQESPGRGVRGLIAGTLIRAGSAKYLQEEGLVQAAQHSTSLLQTLDLRGKVGVSIAIGEQLGGIIILGDELRPGAKELIAQLKHMGIKAITMLTGDNEINASHIAESVGITDFAANLMPQHKVEHVKALTQCYPYTVMVGDGINDAPALASARVGIAMGAHGAGISAEAASVVLLDDDLGKVAEVVAIGRRTLMIAWQSAGLGILLSFGLMCVAALGYIKPVIGALFQEVIDIIVILNALRGISAGRGGI